VKGVITGSDSDGWKKEQQEGNEMGGSAKNRHVVVFAEGGRQ
jgi:hypothetical protein